MVEDVVQGLALGQQCLEQSAEHPTLYWWQIERLGAQNANQVFKPNEVDGPVRRC